MPGHREALLAALIVLAGCGALPGATTTSVPDTTTPTAAVDTGSTPATTGAPTTAATAATTATKVVTVTSATASRDPNATAMTTGANATTTLVTPSPPSIEVVGGSVYRDPGTVWARVVALSNRTGVSPPGRVVVRNLSAMPTISFDERPFYDLFGLGRSAGETRAAGYALSDEVVVVRRQANTPQGEVTLAHEFAHVVQYRIGLVGRNRAATTAARTLERIVVEGAATYLADEYARRYRPGAREHGYVGTRYRNRTGARRLVVAPYWFGLRYYADRIAGPERLREVYARPPRSAEEVLHGLAPGADPSEPPTVSVEGWSAGERDRMGELWLRVALSTELEASGAARAAAGWDGDHRVGIRNGSDGDTRAFAWAVRFDDRANATEFRRLFGAWLADRTGGTAGDDAYRVVGPIDRTVVILAGDPPLVGAADVDVGPEGVTVAPVGTQANSSGTANTTSMPTNAIAAPTPTWRMV